MSEKPTETEMRLAHLEIRLDEYHRELVKSIDQRDQAVLRRSWRFLDWVMFGVTGALAIAFSMALKVDGWLTTVISAITWLVLIFLVAGVTQRREAQDKKKFLGLPEWHRPNWVE